MTRGYTADNYTSVIRTLPDGRRTMQWVKNKIRKPKRKGRKEMSDDWNAGVRAAAKVAETVRDDPYRKQDRMASAWIAERILSLLRPTTGSGQESNSSGLLTSSTTESAPAAEAMRRALEDAQQSLRHHGYGESAPLMQRISVALSLPREDGETKP